MNAPEAEPQVVQPVVRDGSRAAALLVAAFALSIVRPTVLVCIPLVALLMVTPGVRVAHILAGGLAAWVAFSGARGESLWYAERAWGLLLAGWFAALTLRWPATRVFNRALASLVGAVAVAVVVLSARPGSWQALDWSVSDRMRSGMSAGVEAVKLILRDSGGLSPTALAAVQRSVEFQAQVFPAFLGLASLASLGVAWWLYVRLGRGRVMALAPLREFRFNDHLVWVFIAGLALLLAGPTGPWGRAGSNAVVFMGALYALRGLAVLVFGTGGLSFAQAAVFLVGMMFVAPIILGVTLFVGLGDTWLDLRNRRRQPAA